MTPLRIAALAIWASFACIALGVLVGHGDAWGVVLGAVWALLALVEGAAIANPARGDTISDRVHAWLRDRPWRAGLLAGVMLVLFAHWITGWP